MYDRLRNRLDAGRQDGFTLIELLIVIVILGVLAGIVVFAVGTATSDSKVSACKADKKTVQTAVEAYKAKKGEHPATTAAFTSGADATLKAFPTATLADQGYEITYTYVAATKVGTVGTAATSVC